MQPKRSWEKNESESERKLDECLSGRGGKGMKRRKKEVAEGKEWECLHSV